LCAHSLTTTVEEALRCLVKTTVLILQCCLEQVQSIQNNAQYFEVYFHLLPSLKYGEGYEAKMACDV